MDKPDTDIPDELRGPLLQAALPHVPFDGWTDKAMASAAEDLDVNPGLAHLAFPGGPGDMIELLAGEQDQKMVAACTEGTLAPLKIREKITLLVRSRIEAEQEIREATRRAATFLALPINSALGLKILYHTVDLMWKTIHDPSTDFNFYTKRMTLSAVYSTTLLYWLNDESAEYAETWAFLDRRIENVMQFEKGKAQMRKLTAKMPDLWRMAGKMKYGA